MRRWNGWGDDSIEEHVPERALTLLRELVGPSTRPVDASLEEVVAAVAPSRLGADARSTAASGGSRATRRPDGGLAGSAMWRCGNAYGIRMRP